MQKTRSSDDLTTADRVTFDGPFLAHLRLRGLAPKSIERIRWGVRHAARWLARRGRSLVQLPASDFSGIVDFTIDLQPVEHTADVEETFPMALLRHSAIAHFHSQRGFCDQARAQLRVLPCASR